MKDGNEQWQSHSFIHCCQILPMLCLKKNKNEEKERKKTPDLALSSLSII